jgi:hypothetical protein
MRLHHLALAVRDRVWSLAFSARYFRFDPASARTYPDGVVIVRDPGRVRPRPRGRRNGAASFGIPALRVRRGFARGGRVISIGLAALLVASVVLLWI